MNDPSIRATAEDLPIVHLNGSGLENLLEDRGKVHADLVAALEDLRVMAPNGQDYYPDPGRMERALELHRARQLRIQQLVDAIADEIEQLENFLS